MVKNYDEKKYRIIQDGSMFIPQYKFMYIVWKNFKTSVSLIHGIAQEYIDIEFYSKDEAIQFLNNKSNTV
jgi:hypothetical protein